MSRRRPITLPEPVELYRDGLWRRAPEARVETVQDAERFVDAVGLAWTLTDARTPGPSLYIAVCGRRDAHMPPNVQKDPEASAAWLLKDDLMPAREGLLRQAAPQALDAGHDIAHSRIPRHLRDPSA